MARLTLPRMNKETADLVKMNGKLSATRVYLRDLCVNPRSSDMEMVRQLRIAESEIELARGALAGAISNMAHVAKTLERRKASTVR